MIRALPEVFRTTRLIAQRVEERHLADLERHYADPSAVDWLAAPSGSDGPAGDDTASDGATGDDTASDGAMGDGPGVVQNEPVALQSEPAALERAGGWAEWIESFAAPHWQKHGYGLFALYEKQAGEAGATRPFAGLAGLLRVADPDRSAPASEGSRDEGVEHHTSSAAGVSGTPGAAGTHSRAVELVFTLVPEAAGRGYATEIGGVLTGLALTSLDRESVNAVVRPDNDRALRVLEKLGFAEDSEHSRDGAPHVLFRRRR
jgi:RimJ/RimL family protein N-acetyltransferase